MNIRGFNGKYAMVDLTNQTYEIRNFEEKTLKNFLGGPALGAKILYDEMPAHTPWDAPESIVGFVTGPTNASTSLVGGRYTVVSKSPVTGMWNDANSGGHFGPKLRKAGVDAVFVRGISAKPVYIFLDEGKVSFHDASKLWGKTVEATEHAIIDELGDKNVGISLIGPAGETKSHMAAVMNDTHRAAGRGGTGAVMGSKNLKALVCRGNAKVEIADKDALLATNKAVAEWCKSGPIADTLVHMFDNWGTGAITAGSILSGDASVRNWGGVPSSLTEEEINACTSMAMDEPYKVSKYNCNACSLGCGAIYEIKDGKYPIKETGRPEYETNAAFGSNVGAGDPEVVNWCNFLCNEYGYDTISMGGTVSWAIECYENGLFTKEETGGLELKWGNTDAIVKLVEAICKGSSDFGKALNNGAYAAAKHYNRGMEYVIHASGIEIPQHDPRLSPGTSRTYKYDPTPGRHVKGGQGFLAASHLPPEVKYNFDSPDNVVRDLEGVIDTEITNLGGFCLFNVMYPPEHKSKTLTALTGIDYTGENEKKLGLRSQTMRHLFNVREGLKRDDHTINGRVIGVPPMTDGPHKDITIDVEKLSTMYFEAMDWDQKTLVPSKAALEDLGGFEDIIADFHK